MKDNTTVQVHYRGTLTGGEEFDSSIGGEPFTFTIGAGEVLAEFENAVKKLKIGEKTEIDIAARQAYGEYRKELELQIPKENFPPDIKMELGEILQLHTPEGQELIAVIDEINDDTICLNANHPLAGQNLHFEIELVTIEK